MPATAQLRLKTMRVVNACACRKRRESRRCAKCACACARLKRCRVMQRQVSSMRARCAPPLELPSQAGVVVESSV